MAATKDLRGQEMTVFGWMQCFWVLLMTFQYGYHISALNQIQTVLTCPDVGDTPPDRTRFGLPRCIDMSEWEFGLVTSIFTIGGLAGSLCANVIMDKWGRSKASRLSGVLTILGTGIMSVSHSVVSLGAGRMLAGAGAGIGLCVAPIYLSEVSAAKISGNVGVLLQLSIVTGIMFTQFLGLRFASPTQWTTVLFASFALSIIQYGTSIFAVESPAWLAANGLADKRAAVALKLWGSAYEPPSVPDGDVEADPLLDELEERRHDEQISAISVPTLLKAMELRRPLMIVCLAMVSQQLSGVNAVLYYSNAILGESLPQYASWVSIGITIVNFVMTFPPIILVERMGRKSLLTISTLGAVISLVAVGFGLNSGMVTLSAIGVMTFISSFAIGLGPVPFLLIPEISPFHAVSALSTIALSLNWVSNFLVGLSFLPLRTLMSGGDVSKQGRVFYVFAAVLFTTMFFFSRLYRG